MSAAERFARLPTAAKLLLILTAVLLPIGIALALLGESGMRSANRADAGQAEDRARIVAGLAKPPRSNLERKLGRYSIEFPVFPTN